MYFKFKDINIFAFSDTHGRHKELRVPENVDIVICAGDAVEDNLAGNEYDDFIEWFASLPCKWKVFVSGNHELSFELDKAKTITDIMTSKGITVLQDAIEDCDGVIICSISPNITIAKEDIPTDIDLLVTHFPPYGILDEGMGSTEILNFVLHSQPKYHLFGHIRSTRIWLDLILKKRLQKCIDWSRINKNDYLQAMQTSVVNPSPISSLLISALTDKINDRETFMKGIDYSYYYEQED